MFLVETAVTAKCELGEGPVWHPHESALYWLDILQNRLHRYDYGSQEHTVTGLGRLVSAVGLRQGGGLVTATRHGFAFWDPATAEFDFLGGLDPSEDPENRFNDGKTDRQGRFWAGKMSGKACNSLFRLNPDRTVKRMESGVTISNGLGWSPDDRTFYFTDTPARKIYAFDFDSRTGDIVNRRDFVTVPDTEGEGFPDGLAVDSEGCIWSARWGGWKVVRYDAQGQVICVIEMPVAYPTSCAFGGPDLNELFITSAWTAHTPAQRRKNPRAGDLFRVKVDTTGLPEPFFAG